MWRWDLVYGALPRGANLSCQYGTPEDFQVFLATLLGEVHPAEEFPIIIHIALLCTHFFAMSCCDVDFWVMSAVRFQRMGLTNPVTAMEGRSSISALHEATVRPSDVCTMASKGY